jgi:hypothetical protein
LKHQGAAVGLGDLAAEDEPNACAYGFRGEEGHKKVCGVGQSRPFIFDQ